METFKTSLVTILNWDFKTGSMIGLLGICEPLKLSITWQYAFFFGEGLYIFHQVLKVFIIQKLRTISVLLDVMYVTGRTKTPPTTHSLRRKVAFV